MENLDTSVKTERISYGDQIVVATNFLYRDYKLPVVGEPRHEDDTDGIRGDLALKSLKRALRLGVRIVASDGGSSPDFLSALEAFQDGLVIVHSEDPNRGPQRRNAFGKAIALPNALAIVYTQGEKNLADFLVKITKPIIEGNADIVIPKRNPELFKLSYPGYMRKSELEVNATYDWLMQKAGLMKKDESFDWFFGPVVFRNDPEIVALFLKRYALEDVIRSRAGANPDPDMHSDGHYFPVIEALFKKMRVVSVEVPFVYPATQKANEMSPEMMPRFMERRTLDGAAYRLEAIHFLRFLKGKLGSKIREIIS